MDFPVLGLVLELDFGGFSGLRFGFGTGFWWIFWSWVWFWDWILVDFLVLGFGLDGSSSPPTPPSENMYL